MSTHSTTCDNKVLPYRPWTLLALLLCLFMAIGSTDAQSTNDSGWQAQAGSEQITLSGAGCRFSQADTLRQQDDDDQGSVTPCCTAASPCWQLCTMLHYPNPILPSAGDAFSLPFSTGPPNTIPV